MSEKYKWDVSEPNKGQEEQGSQEPFAQFANQTVKSGESRKRDHKHAKLGLVGAGMATFALAFGALQGAPRSADGGQHGDQNRNTTSELYDPSPSATAVDLGGSPSPDASQSPEATPSTPYTILNPDPADFKVEMGTSKDVPANTVIVGDALAINGSAWTDSDALTGLITIMKEPGTVSAGSTWSIDEMEFATYDEAVRFALAKYTDLDLAGCGLDNGCETVDVLEFPGDKQGVQANHYDELKAQYGEGQPSPSSSPEASATIAPDYQALIDELLALDPETLTLDQKMELAELQLLLDIKNCTCNTGECGVHPSPTPSMSPTPTPTSTTEVCETNDYEIGPDQTKIVNGPAIIQGDVWVDGKRYFDSNGDTFAILRLTGDHDYRVRINGWKADVQEICVNNPNYDDIYKHDLELDSADGRTLDKNSTVIN